MQPLKKQVQLYVCRHGQTEANVARILQGQTDSPLTQLGIQQANDLGEKLKNIKFDMGIVSDLQRTRRTFEIISEKLDFQLQNIEFSEQIREINTGTYSGQPVDIYYTESQRLGVNLEEFRPDNGGESYSDLNKRAQDFYKMLLDNKIEQFLSSQDEQQYYNLLVISHGGFTSAFFNVLFGKYMKIQNCCINLVNFEYENGEIKHKLVIENDQFTDQVSKRDKERFDHTLNM